MSSKYNYKGKTIYIGLDVHKNTYSVVTIYDNEVVKKDRITASPEGLVTYINKYFAGACVYSAYEAGFSGFHLHRYLIKGGINNIVVHPSAIEISARDKVKTDKRDALKIATQLSDRRLKSIHVPSEAREAKRTVTRLRSTLMRDRHRINNRMKALFFQYGLINAYDDTRISKRWISKILKELKQNNYAKDFYYTLGNYTKQWLDITERIKEIDKHLVEQAKSESGLDMIYRSVPGVGALTARILANELGDMSQFSSEKKLFSFTGLTPSERSSGEIKRLGHISRQSRSVLRQILVEASWIAIRYDHSLKKIYENIAKRAGGKRAIVGIARRLIARIRACLLTGELYKIRTGEI